MGVIAAHDLAINICELGLSRSEAIERLNDLCIEAPDMINDEYDSIEADPKVS